ncbi:hypothetical protein HDU77_005936 [Chytriomyces hyalinus]|nr:hypothetical protein HDU77_005936 [Chytriomyces hyalinus]
METESKPSTARTASFLAAIYAAVLFVTISLVVVFAVNPGGSAHPHLIHAFTNNRLSDTTPQQHLTTSAALEQGIDTVVPAHASQTGVLSTTPAATDVNSTNTGAETPQYDLAAVDLAQIRLIDYLNGELGAKDENIFGGSLQQIPNGHFNLTDTWTIVNAFSQTLQNDTVYDRKNFSMLARRARSLFIAYRVLNELPHSELDAIAADSFTENISAKNRTAALKEQLKSAVAVQTNTLYPWINPPFETLSDMQTFFKNSSDSVGIAITGGSRHYYLIMHQILSLRKEFDIKLPIHVFYGGEQDMNATLTDAFNAMENVKAVDLTQIFPTQTKLQDRGYSMKPFAILAAPFRTVLFIDADALFFKSPLHALESTAFKRTGQLFFHDRYLREESGMKGPDFLNEIHKHLSRYGNTLGFPNARTRPLVETHELDSGFLVLDKSNTGVLFSLLLASKMNSVPQEKGILYGKTHGDKESFWFASELLHVPYQFNGPYGGAIGTWREGEEKDKENGVEIVCSAFILQLDEKRELFWWNGGGVLKDRYATNDFANHFATFTHVSLDFDGDGTQWFDFFPGGGCVRKPSKYVKELSSTHQDLMERYRQRFIHDIKDPSPQDNQTVSVG